MESIGDRIGKLVILSGLSKKEFAEKIDITEQAMGNYINNRRTPKAEILLKMKQVFGVSIDWMLTGKGDVFKNKLNNKVDSVRESSDKYQKYSELQDKHIKLLESEVERLKCENSQLKKELGPKNHH